jgi:Xaa-Pro aminopeptidase
VTRLERLAARLETALLVTNPVNVRYLTGLDSSNAALLVDPAGAPTLFTDFRYLEAAGRVAEIVVHQTRGNAHILADVGERLAGTVGFEADAVTVAQFEQLRAGGAEVVAGHGVVEALREIKDDDEIASIRRAALAAERAFEALSAETWVGRSEREVAWRLEQLFHAHGADGLAFETIIAAGAQGSLPHARPTDALVEPRTLVIADFGARIGGYCSDCTRTLATGDLPAGLREIYDICLIAQLAAVDGIAPGMSAADADALARTVIADAGYGEQFGHSLGHGVGLDIHEAPRLGRDSTDTIEVGQVITIEPGIYLPGVGGVRIEDLAVVTDTGVELLTAFPKELVFVS